MERSYCSKHLSKMIFEVKESATAYMRDHHPNINYRIYPCPENLGHFHVQNKTKKNRRKHLKRRGKDL